MVVLDQHAIVEAEAVIDPAAGSDRLLLQRPQARGRLAGAGDPRVMRPRGRDGGDPREVAQEVQRYALCGQHRPCRAVDAHHRLADLDFAAVGPVDGDAHRRIEQPERQCGRLGPGDRAALQGDNGPGAGCPGRKQRVARDVACAAQILEQGRTHDRLDQENGQGCVGLHQAALTALRRGSSAAASSMVSARAMLMGCAHSAEVSGWSRRR